MAQVILQGKYSEDQFEEFKKLLGAEVSDVKVHQGFTKSAEVSSFVQFAINHFDPIDLLVGYAVGKALDAALSPLVQKLTTVIKKVFAGECARSVWVTVQVSIAEKQIAVNLYVPIDEETQELFWKELSASDLPADATMISIGFESGHIKVIKM